jgi:diguanylate cyclase (GGDEF)-like protein/PAS domain S-box-containing protein
MLRDSEERLSLALESSRLALFDWDIPDGEVFLSEQWGPMLGRERVAVRTKFDALEQLVHPDDRASVGSAIRDALKGVTAHYRVEHRIRTDAGEWIWIQTDGQVTARDAGGRALRFIGTVAEVTERKRAEHALVESRRKLEHAAMHDPLTGLVNRSALDDRLEHALARWRRTGQLLAVLCLDLDRFKEINDTMGHAAGDAVLREFSARIGSCVRASDTAARLGGDEFVVLLEDLSRPDDARAIADKMLHVMREELRINSRRLVVTTSIGIAFAGGAATGEGLLRQADAALYEAKRAGRNTFRVAPPAMEIVDASASGAGQPDRPERAQNA